MSKASRAFLAAAAIVLASNTQATGSGLSAKIRAHQQRVQALHDRLIVKRGLLRFEQTRVQDFKMQLAKTNEGVASAAYLPTSRAAH